MITGESSGLSLRRNFSWTVIGNGTYAFCQWGIISVLTKIGSAEMVGQFALGLAVVTPIAAFFQFQLRGVQATDASGSFDLSEYLTLRLATTAIAIVVTLIVTVLGGFALGSTAVVMLIAAERAVGSVADIFYGAFQQRERMDVIAHATILNGIFSLILATAGVWVTGLLVIGVLGYLAGTAVSLSYVFLKERPIIRRSGARWLSFDWDRLRTLLVLVFPLGVVMFVVSLSSSIPRYALQSSWGTKELGIFAALSYLLVAGNTVVGALGQSAAPRLAAYFAAGDISAFWHLSQRLMVAGLTLGGAGFALALVAGSGIISVIYTPEYAGYTNVLAMLSISGGVSFAASISGYAMTAAREFAVQAPLFGAVLLVSAVASFALIPTFGLQGAVTSMTIASVFQLLLSILVLRRATHRRAAMGE